MICDKYRGKNTGPQCVKSDVISRGVFVFALKIKVGFVLAVDIMWHLHPHTHTHIYKVMT
jgi:hypothetical protein